jgi:hypothetical protein
MRRIVRCSAVSRPRSASSVVKLTISDSPVKQNPFDLHAHSVFHTEGVSICPMRGIFGKSFQDVAYISLTGLKPVDKGV